MKSATLAVIFAIMALVTPQLAYAGDLPTLSLKSITPQPAEPGGDLSIVITITNPSDSVLRDFTIDYQANPVFVLKSFKEGIDASQGYRICANCKTESTYFFIVKPDTSSGIYPIFFKATKQGDSVIERVNVEVKGKPNIVFEVIRGGLDSLIPKSEFNLVLEVKNIGTGSAREIKVSPESSNFISLGSSIKTIDLIEPKKSEKVRFDFLVGDNIKADSYNIPIRIEYKNERGENLTQSQNLGVRVVNKGTINIQSIKIASEKGSSVITAGEPFTVIVRLENVGEGDANFIKADLLCPFNSPKTSFIGKLEKDEDSPAVFDFVSNQAGAFDCILKINYEDDLGKNAIEETVAVEITGPSIASFALPIIIIIAIIVLIFRKRIFHKERRFALFRKK